MHTHKQREKERKREREKERKRESPLPLRNRRQERERESKFARAAQKFEDLTSHQRKNCGSELGFLGKKNRHRV
jgi:hypothetical protein